MKLRALRNSARPISKSRWLAYPTASAAQWGKKAPHCQWLEIDYPALVRDPAPAVAQLVQFLGQDRLPNESAMRAAIDPALHRRQL